MPKDKRKVEKALTMTRKAGFVRKEQLVTGIRQCVDKYPVIVSFQTLNMRNTFLKDIRMQWESKARFFFGRNKVMRLAFGADEESEYKKGLHMLAGQLIGACGLCFTTVPKEEILEFLRNYREMDYARGGFVATEDVALEEGYLPAKFEPAMEPYLRNTLLMPTELRDGKVWLLRDFEVCTKGEKITPENARILKILGIKMSPFFFSVTCVAEKSADGESFECEIFEDDEEEAAENEEDIEEEEEEEEEDMDNE